MPDETGWVNGTLVVVDDVGVLLTGRAGVGKSETALALVARGHKLVSDDGVALSSAGSGGLSGSAPDCCAGFLLVRDLGSLDLAQLYGQHAVTNEHSVDLIVDIAPGETESSATLYGSEQSQMLHGCHLPVVTLSGDGNRSWWVLVEAATKNYLQRCNGVDAAATLAHRHTAHLQSCEA